MSNKLKVSADTSEAKKSILDLGRSFKDLKGSKISIFSEEDRRFMKTEFKKELGLIKNKIKENREEIKKMVAEQQKMVQGSKEELEQRKKILESYKIQAKLGSEMGKVQSGMGGGGDGGGIEGIAAKIGTVMAGLGVAAGAWALMKNFQAVDQYKAGAPSRNRLKGLGVFDENFGSPEELAKVGLSEQDMIGRRVEATATLGRGGTSQDEEMKKAAFERAFGLQGGTMTGVAGQFRGQVGGRGATDMQMKLQGSILASGIEDALGPYLQSAVQLLSSINENGTANTAEMTAVMGQLTKSGERSPEQIARSFIGINSAIKGSTGEANAFLQTAFAKAGIGGGTLGGTKFALSSGGLMGMNKGELSKRGYNPQLLQNLEKAGMFSGVGQRSNAIMDMFKSASGGQKISDVTDVNKYTGLGNMANSVFGTKGEQGFDVLKMLEQVENKQMTESQFDKQLKGMVEDQDPTVKRLSDINKTLSGETELLTNIDKNLSEYLGKQSVQGRNEVMKFQNTATRGMGRVEKQMFDPDEVTKSGVNPNSTSLKDKLLDTLFGVNRYGFGRSEDFAEKSSTQKVDIDYKKMADAHAEALKDVQINNQTNVKNIMPDGTVTDRVTK